MCLTLKTNSDRKLGIMLSWNQRPHYYEKDILVLWVNDSIKQNPRWQFDAMHFALTHARRAIFIIGSTNTLRVCLLFMSLILFQLYCIAFCSFILLYFCSSIIQEDPGWNSILEYARGKDKEFDLNLTDGRPFFP